MGFYLSRSLRVVAGVLIFGAAVRLWQVTSNRGEVSILHRRIDNIDLDAVPLNEALSRVAALAGTTISFDPTFTADKEHAEYPVYLHLENFESGEAFERLMRGFPQHYIVEQKGGRLRLHDYASEPYCTRIYDVHDLIDRWSASPYSIQPGYEGDSLSLGANPPISPSHYETRQELLRHLVQLMTDEIEPDTWEMSNGVNSIATVGEFLCVSAPSRVQKEIIDFLQPLREAESAAPIPPVTEADSHRIVWNLK